MKIEDRNWKTEKNEGWRGKEERCILSVKIRDESWRLKDGERKPRVHLASKCEDGEWEDGGVTASKS